MFVGRPYISNQSNQSYIIRSLCKFLLEYEKQKGDPKVSSQTFILNQRSIEDSFKY